MNHIIILYHKFEIDKRIFFAGFFRLCGVYEQEIAIEDLHKQNTIQRSDIVLLINKRESEDEHLDSLSDHIINVKYKEEVEIEELENMCKNYIHAVKETTGLDAGLYGRDEAEAADVLMHLAEIYKKNDLEHANYQMRLVFNITNKEEDLKTAEEHFQETLTQIPDPRIPDSQISRFSFYFENECKRKIDMARRMAKKSKIYDSGEVLIGIKKYLDKHKECVELWSLCGLIADEDIRKIDEAGWYYLQFIEKYKFYHHNDRYTGFAYYRLGRYYEKIRQSNIKALQCYQKAYNLDPDNYRFIYKVAWLKEISGNYVEAIKLYKEIIVHMEDYAQKNYLTPCQCEYLFKVYIRLMQIYNRKQKQYMLARRMADKAKDLRKQIMKNEFFDKFYKKDSKILKEEMQESLEIEPVNEELTDINNQLKRFE